MLIALTSSACAGAPAAPSVPPPASDTAQPSNTAQPSAEPGASAQSGGAGQGAATQVITVVGVTRSGAPAPGYRVEDGSSTVSGCEPSAAGGADVVECTPSAAGANVCWVAADRVTLYCGESPWEKKLSKMRSDDPVGHQPPEHNPRPWGVVLADGARCTLRNGGAWGGRSDGLVAVYSCDRQDEYILAEPTESDPVVNKSNPHWTVRVGDLGSGPDPKFPPPRNVAVRTAYLVGP